MDRQPLAFLLALSACSGSDAPGVPPAAVTPPEASAAARAAPTPGDGPWFVDVAEESGLGGFRHRSGTTGKAHLLEAMGGGLAWLDYDNDGNPDLHLSNGDWLERSPGEEPPRDALYRNRGDGHFVDVSRTAGVAEPGWTMGATAADYDGDGLTDLLLTNFGPDVLFRNRGDGTFVDATHAAGLGDSDWSTGAVFFDADGDRDLDLYVAGYLEFTTAFRPDDPASCTYRGHMVAYGPRGFPPTPDRFYRNDGRGRLVAATEQAGIRDRSGFGFQPVAFDADEDGDLDLFVANDSKPSFLWRNDGQGRFVEAGLEVGLALNARGREQASMGVALGDADGDGHADLFVTTFSDDYYTLHHALGGGLFADATAEAGLLEPTWPNLGWGAVFFDAELDGDEDLFAVNAHTYPQVDEFDLGTRYRQRNQLFRNDGALRFREITDVAGPGFVPARTGRGAAPCDYDHDGDLDLAVNNLDAAPTLLRNDTPRRGHWLAVELHGSGAGRDPVGAIVRVTAGGREQVRFFSPAQSFLSTGGRALHFGIGAASSIDALEVRWPDGVVQRIGNVSADSRLRLTHGGRNPAAAGSRLD